MKKRRDLQIDAQSVCVYEEMARKIFHLLFHALFIFSVRCKCALVSFF